MEIFRMKQLDSRMAKQLALLFVLLLLGTYVPVLQHGFFVDDDVYVGAQNRVLFDLPASELWRLLVERGNSWEFLPVRDFTYWLDMRLLGDFPDGFHASNLVWYLFATYAVYRFVAESLALYLEHDSGQAAGWAALTALLFFAHPAHVEVVAWISGRKDLVATAFAALGGAYYLSGIRRGWSSAGMAAAALCCLLALFSKSVAAFFVAPLALIAVDARCWHKPPDAWRFWAYCLFPLIGAALALFVHMQIGVQTGIGIENAPGLAAVLERASRITSSLVGILVFPHDLRLIYDVYELSDWHWAVFVLCLLFGIWAVSSLCRGRRSLLALAMLVGLAPLLPYLQLSPYVTWSLASERFVFQASLGIVLAWVLLLRSFGLYVALSVVLVLTLACVLQIVPRVAQWESASSLRRHEMSVNAGNHNVVREYVVGHLLPERKFDEARAVAVRVHSSDAQNLLLRLIDAAEYHRHGKEDAGDSERRRSEYCSVALPLDVDLIRMRGSKVIPDISFINFAGHLRAYLNKALSDVSVACR